MDISFFSTNIELLGGIQTFVGVMITLIVLCLFNDKSNFIKSLTDSIWNEWNSNTLTKRQSYTQKFFEDDLAAYKDIIQDQLSLKPHNSHLEILSLAKGKDKDDLLELLSQSWKLSAELYNELTTVLNKESKSIRNLDNSREEDAYIQVFLLIISVFVMTIDSMFVSEYCGSFCLLCFSYFIVIYGIGMWWMYTLNIDVSLFKQQLKINEIQETIDNTIHLFYKFIIATINIKKNTLTHIVFPIIGFILLFLLGLPLWVWLICFTVSMVLISCLYIKMLKHRDYGYHYAIGQALWSIFTVIVLSITVYYTRSSSVIFDSWHQTFPRYFQLWNDNIQTILNPNIARFVFAFVISLFGFFIPLGMAPFAKIIRYNNSRKDLKKQFDKIFEKKKNELITLQQEYSKICDIVLTKIEYEKNDSQT